MKTILFLCTGNSCRSILAEACFNALAPAGMRAMSAGSRPVGYVHPRSLAVLAREGLPTAGYASKSWDQLPARPDLVITVCGSAAGETCPAYLAPVPRAHWGVARFDLMQVHNLVAWAEHLPRLFEMKAAGQLRYVGVTTSHGRRHAELAQIMRTQPLDFVQLTYNPADRAAERQLLPLALDRGIAVIANRPFQGGALPDRLQREPLPGWAAEIGCTHWAQVVLKFIASHPAVTCAIPATSQLDHLHQNMAAARGLLPDADLRRRLVQIADRL